MTAPNDPAPASPEVPQPLGFQVARHAGELPGLASLGPLLSEAEGLGLVAVVATHAGDADTLKILAKRRHDLKAALRTMGFTVKALESGYRFDDDKKDAKIAAIAKALAVLTREGDLALAILGGS